MRMLLAATVLATGAASLPAGVGAPLASAQDTASAGIISAIRVEGNQRASANTIESYLLVQPGDPFDPARLDLSLKTLFATNQFADIAFERDGSVLVVRVVENPRINRVIFEGNRALNDDKLREEIEASPRDVFTAARVQADTQRILELYRQSGRFAARVEPQYKPLEQNRVDLIFSVSEGPVTGVRSINIIGNEDFSDNRLRREIATKQSRLWRFFSSSDNYDPGRLEFDREQLREFYQNRGYYDFRVDSAVAELTPDREAFFITYTIEEGEPYTFGDIRVETALEKLNGDALRRALPLSTGDLYRGSAIESATDTLNFAAGIAGYASVEINPRIEADPETREVNLVFEIDEGPRVYVERIDITGNSRTLDRVIRREMRISEGDAFNRVLIDRSRSRIRSLGFFEEVEIVETAGTEADRTVVQVQVTEQPTGELSASAGFSSNDQFLIDLAVTERNLRGRGQNVVARINASDRQQVIDFRFTEPRFLDRNLAATSDLFVSRTDFSDFREGGFASTAYGGGVRLAFPLTERTNFGLRYRLEYNDLDVNDREILFDPATGLDALTTVTDDNGTPDDPSDDSTFQDFLPLDTDPLPPGIVRADICDPLYFGVFATSLCDSEQSDWASILGYSFFWDRRNDTIEPTRGFDLSVNQDVAGLGGDVNYLRTELGAGWYRGITKGVRFSARLSGGFIEPFGNDDGVRINNRFFRGGNNFRGFDVAGLGAREIVQFVDVDTGEIFRTDRGRPLGGNVYYQGTFELSIPDFLPEEYGIRSALFVDAGSLGILSDTDRAPVRFDTGVFDIDGRRATRIFQTKDALSLRAAGGLSVFWRSPFGPIRLDFSQIISREDYDRTETFRFSTSTRF